MNAFKFSLVLLVSNIHLFAEENSKKAKTEIPVSIADGTPSPVVKKPALAPATIINSVTKRVKVIEEPEMAGLPPIRGTINRTVQLVADPGLPDPPPPLPLLPVSDPAVQSRLADARARYRETQILFVSARVIDYQKTILEVFPNGNAKEAVSVVSSIDFNDFSGFGTFNVAGDSQDENAEPVRRYSLIMGIGNEITGNKQRLAAKAGRTYIAPELPTIPESDTPSFVVLEGDNKAALQVIHDMHTLYAVEGTRMHTSRLAREKAHKERMAYLLANPPKPQDVTLKFWKRNKPSANISR